MPAGFLDCEGTEEAKPKAGDGEWRRVEETPQKHSLIDVEKPDNINYNHSMYTVYTKASPLAH